MKVLSTINACMLLIYAAFFLLHRDTLGAEESEDVTDWISPVCHKLCGTLSRACGSTKCTWQSPDLNKAEFWGSQWNTVGRTLSETSEQEDDIRNPTASWGKLKADRWPCNSGLPEVLYLNACMLLTSRGVFLLQSKCWCIYMQGFTSNMNSINHLSYNVNSPNRKRIDTGYVAQKKIAKVAENSQDSQELSQHSLSRETAFWLPAKSLAVILNKHFRSMGVAKLTTCGLVPMATGLGNGHRSSCTLRT